MRAVRQRSPRHVPARHAIAVSLLALLAGACSTEKVTENQTLFRFGAISFHATSGNNATAIATSTAIFFDAYSASVPDSHTPPDYCQYSTVDTTTTNVKGTLQAGSSLNLRYGSGASALMGSMSFETAAKRYTSPAITYKSGDSVQVVVPGDIAGFPESAISIRLAEPLLPNAVTVPTGTSPLSIRWNASGDPLATAVIISLRYANPASMPYANEQILCVLRDDGAEDIESTALAPFKASPAAMRSLTLTRWRTQVVRPTTYTLLHIVSSVDTLIKLQ